jgi:hypothetical protein
MQIEAIQLGQAFKVHSIHDKRKSLTLSCSDLDQRIWSRVATANTINKSAGKRQQYFVKQYRGKDGDSHEDHWTFEQEGVLLASELFGDIVVVPKLLYQNKELLINVFEFVEVVPIDELLRTDAASFNANIKSTLDKLAEVLSRMQNPPASIDTSGIKIKTRSFGESTAINFKGIDIRNVGIGMEGKVKDNVIIFDLVRPYMAPIEDAGSKMFLSVGMLNWGHPVKQFLKGPDEHVLKLAAHAFKPFLNKDALSKQIRIEKRHRTEVFVGATGFEVKLKNFASKNIGKRYLKRLEQWLARNMNIS